MRQRDVFPLPLPYPHAPSLAGAWHKSRALRRRLRGTGGWQQWANDVVDTLNRLAGLASADLPPTALQQNVLEHVGRACREMGKPPDGLTPAGAFIELCGAKLPYLGEGAGPVPI